MTLKIKTFFLILKDPRFLKIFLIDVLFYAYLIFGFIVAAHISSANDIPVETASIYWVAIFIPILVLKLVKEINRDKINRDFLYREKDED